MVKHQTAAAVEAARWAVRSARSEAERSKALEQLKRSEAMATLAKAGITDWPTAIVAFLHRLTDLETEVANLRRRGD